MTQNRLAYAFPACAHAQFCTRTLHADWCGEIHSLSAGCASGRQFSLVGLLVGLLSCPCRQRASEVTEYSSCKAHKSYACVWMMSSTLHLMKAQLVPDMHVHTQSWIFACKTKFHVADRVPGVHMVPCKVLALQQDKCAVSFTYVERYGAAHKESRPRRQSISPES